MRAIGLDQPWASLVAAGIKTVETRDWSTSWRGPLAIHANKKWTEEQADQWADFAEEFAPRLAPLRPWVRKVADRDIPPLGCVVALATLTDCGMFTESRDVFVGPFGTIVLGHGPWGSLSPEDTVCGDTAPGRWGWKLERVLRLDHPLPMRGQQGLWTPEPAERAALAQATGWWANERNDLTTTDEHRPEEAGGP